MSSSCFAHQDLGRDVCVLALVCVAACNSGVADTSTTPVANCPDSTTHVDNSNTPAANPNVQCTNPTSISVVSLQVSVASAVAVGQSSSLTVTAVDANDAVAPYSGTVHFSSSDAEATLPADYTFGSADHGTHTFVGLAFANNGLHSVRVTDTHQAGIFGNAADIVVNPLADHFAVVASPNVVALGQPFSLEVRAEDANDTQVADYAGTVTFTTGAAGATLPDSYTFIPADAGLHVFNQLALGAAGPQSVAVAADGGNPAGQAALTVLPNAAGFLVTADTNSVTPDTFVNLTVQAVDSQGHGVAGYTGTVSWTSADPKALLPADTTFVSCDAGVKVVRGCKLLTQGDQTVTVQDAVAGLTGTLNFTVNVGRAVGFAISGLSSVTLNQSATFSVEVVDAGGNAIADYTGDIAFTPPDPSVTLPSGTFSYGSTSSSSSANHANGILRFYGGALFSAYGVYDVTVASLTGQALSGTVAVSLGVQHLSIGADAQSVCAVWQDGGLKCWGDNSGGELGLGDTQTRGTGGSDMGANLPFVNTASAAVLQVSAGLQQACAIVEGQGTTCWGNNTLGTLGLGDVLTRDAPNNGGSLALVDLGTGRTAVQLASGRYTAGNCALLDDGTIKCWGPNTDGTLGLGDSVERGAAAGDMGDCLPAIDLGQAVRAQAVSVGSGNGMFACAQLIDGNLKCWGSNGQGQLGLGDTTNRGAAPTDMGAALPTVDLGAGRTVVAVSTGGAHACALLDDTTLRCWGDNTYGQLGLGDTLPRGAQANTMGAQLAAVDLGGANAAAVSAGARHTCALLQDSSVKCWGANDVGQLGQEDTQQRGDSNTSMGANLAAIDLGSVATPLAVSSGDDTTCVVMDNAQLKCWGAGANGALGLGDAANRGDQPGSMGDSLPFVQLW